MTFVQHLTYVFNPSQLLTDTLEKTTRFVAVINLIVLIAFSITAFGVPGMSLGLAMGCAAIVLFPIDSFYLITNFFLNKAKDFMFPRIFLTMFDPWS